MLCRATHTSEMKIAPERPSACEYLRSWKHLPRGSGMKRAAQTEPARGASRGSPAPSTVSGRWLAAAVCGTISAAALCGWGVLCLLFWQGSWQLLYHPAAEVTRTPASAGLAYDPVEFDPSPEGTPQLKGWWVPAAPGAPFGRYTVLFLHGQTGNIGDQVNALAALHAVGVNAMAFDYRGYGQSQFARPSEAHWRQDAEAALEYLTKTRHVDAGSIVLDGEGLGANLALETGAAHPELAGMILESPLQSPMTAIFDDARAKLVPAHLLVRDRYDLRAAATKTSLPVVWFAGTARDEESGAYEQIEARKMFVSVDAGMKANQEMTDALTRWLDELPVR